MDYHMSQVSKRFLAKDIELKLYQTLWESLAKLKSQNEIQAFLADLLSPVERTMVAKRLAIAVFLEKGYSYNSIKNILKVSATTIAKISLILSGNKGYKLAISKIAQGESMGEFWQLMLRFAKRMNNAKNLYASDEYLKKKSGHLRKTLV